MNIPKAIKNYKKEIKKFQKAAKQNPEPYRTKYKKVIENLQRAVEIFEKESKK